MPVRSVLRGAEPLVCFCSLFLSVPLSFFLSFPTLALTL